ncbi:NAD-dependent succinate-semialdehyde dehydrogenase [Janibacter limosus]|uniref:NAD-dependent succinate-semialdehyde dehydrogenase n=1 Tax=Janibacter limosus TaxID=53458 RepID=UPI0035D653CA
MPSRYGVAVTRTSVRAIVRRVGEIYGERRDELARTIAVEMGKPLKEGHGEVAICASIYNYYADHAQELLADEEIDIVGGGSTAMVRKEPVGTLLGIMPRNFPYYQVARFAAPNLVLGNTIILKHAPQCPQSAALMEEIFPAAGVPEGAYVNVYATNEQVADVIADPRIRGVSLTGSERAGAAVAEIAGRHLKKVVLELGGSDPYLVLEDAVVADAVRGAVSSRFRNAGRACNAAKRIIVHEKIYDDFVTQLTDSVRSLRVGDPLEGETFMGPMSSERAATDLEAQVDDAVAHGAKVLHGGSRPDQPGAWFTPTVLVDVPKSARAWSEELFGPVAVVYKVASDDEAVALANSSAYGLGASVNSADVDRALAVGSRLESGMLAVNEPSASSAETPFGGVKRSGFGRELGKYGIEEFCNHRLVRIRT